MQQIDAAAIETLGIPRLLLMEHAGLAVARTVQAMTPASSHPIVICCGTGYNGGDGMAAARHLCEYRYPIRIVLAGALHRLREEPAIYANMLTRLNVPLMPCETLDDVRRCEPWFAACALIVDALLGIGTKGTVREPIASLIREINDSGKSVVAVDLPSGLDGDTGLVQGIAVKATTTVTFGLVKRGCLNHQGPAHTGSLVVDPITIPRQLLEALP